MTNGIPHNDFALRLAGPGQLPVATAIVGGTL
jgi:hypothetical protein